MIRTERYAARKDDRTEKADTSGAENNLPLNIINRGTFYRYLSSLLQKGWQLEDLDKTGAKLSMRSDKRQQLFIAGLLLLPLMGFGLLIWALAICDVLSGEKYYLLLPFEGLRKGKKPLRGRLNLLQRVLLGVFGLMLTVWLLVALPVLFPQSYRVILPLPEGITYRLQPKDDMHWGGVVPLVGISPVSGAAHAIAITPSPTATHPEASPIPTMTPLLPLNPTFTATATATPTPTSTPRPDPADWMDWPVLPKFSPHWLEIYQDGIENGNNPQSFSVVGDCQSVPYLFMGMYDGAWYSTDSLSASLQDTVEFFSGSFSRYGMTILDGATAASVLAPGWANRNWCDVDESPLACELRLHKPSFVIINIGTHWTARNGEYMRSIVETAIAAGALPILTTKGDNLEGDHSINLQIARIASEYDIPLWNLWRAVQGLSGNGLDPYRQGGNMYYTSAGLETRRTTALQLLDLLRQAVD